jgi:hypothetical protein
MPKPRILIPSDVSRALLVRHARTLWRGEITALSPSLQYFELTTTTPTGRAKIVWLENTLETICEFLDEAPTRSNAFA